MSVVWEHFLLLFLKHIPISEVDSDYVIIAANSSASLRSCLAYCAMAGQRCSRCGWPDGRAKPDQSRNAAESIQWKFGVSNITKHLQCEYIIQYCWRVKTGQNVVYKIKTLLKYLFIFVAQNETRRNVIPLFRNYFCNISVSWVSVQVLHQVALRRRRRRLFLSPHLRAIIKKMQLRWLNVNDNSRHRVKSGTKKGTDGGQPGFGVPSGVPCQSKPGDSF